MTTESSRTRQRPADVLVVEAVRKPTRALKRKSRLHCCEGVFMSDIAFNPGVGSGYPGPIDRTGQAAASTSRSSISPASENQNTNPGDRIEFSDQAALVAKALSEESSGYDPVPALREAIANGTYDLEGRLGEAIDGLIADLD